MSLHPLLKQQFDDSREEGGRLDLRKLLHAISEAYAEWDEERHGVVRSMRLLADETSAFTREVRESAAAQLQVVLDHVKDAIITVDGTGRVETLNTTGERVFGYGEQEVRGRKLDLLIPSLASRPSIVENIVLKGPLFPLNSLMTQGVAYSRHGMAGDPTFNSQGFKDDVRAFFGSGTGLQELYIQPDKLTTGDWRTLAEVAKWSRTNANVLVDTHWIGGDPSELQVYGYASWNGRKGIVMLRNPADQPHEFELDLATALELPAGPPASFLLSSPWAEDTAVPKLHAEVGKPVTFRLQPFEVIVRDVVPLK